MFWIIMGLLLVLPIVEIALIVEVGQATNWLVVVALTIATAVIGAAIIKRQGLAAASEYRAAAKAGEVPVGAAVDGIALLLAAPFLMTPGFVTDAFGFAMLIPAVRHAAARTLLERLRRRVRDGKAQVTIVRR